MNGKNRMKMMSLMLCTLIMITSISFADAAYNQDLSNEKHTGVSQDNQCFEESWSFICAMIRNLDVHGNKRDGFSADVISAIVFHPHFPEGNRFLFGFGGVFEVLEFRGILRNHFVIGFAQLWGPY